MLCCNENGQKLKNMTYILSHINCGLNRLVALEKNLRAHWQQGSVRSPSCGRCGVEQWLAEPGTLLGVASPGRGTLSPLCSDFSPMKVIYRLFDRYNERTDTFIKNTLKNRKTIWQVEMCFMNLLTRFCGNRSLLEHFVIGKIHKGNQEGWGITLRNNRRVFANLLFNS